MKNAVRNVIVLGAAGRDFHNFNVALRGDARYRVVAFTATQIPGIAGRVYPAALCGGQYPDGIPIRPEAELAGLIREHAVDDVIFAYSDVTHPHVMHLAAVALANGASFHLLGPCDVMLYAPCPVVAVVAGRTGAGKSTVTRELHAMLLAAGRKPVVVRHPMPYGRFDRGVERYATAQDVLEAGITIEGMEEYQPHVDAGAVVYAGVDYAAVLARAAADGDLILWDGGNNDMAFYRPRVTVTLADPLRPGEEDAWFPGEANIRTADVLVVTKANVADAAELAGCEHALRSLNPTAPIIRMQFEEIVDRPELLAGARVLAIEDGPSVTHGGLSEARAARAARLHGATLVDPRPFAVGAIKDLYAQYPHIGAVLPALGYSAAQCVDLQRTIAAIECDAVALGTPADLPRLMRIDRPVVRVTVKPDTAAARELAGIVLDRLSRD